MADLNDFFVTDDITDNLASYHNRLVGGVIASQFVNTETISGTKELADSDCQNQVLTASGSDQDVELAPESGSTNHFFFIKNPDGATYDLVIKDDSGVTTYCTLDAGEWAYCVPIGSTWNVIYSGSISTTPTFTSLTVSGSSFSLNGVTVTFSDAAPGSPTADDLWWETDTGILWTYGTYASASRWVSVDIDRVNVGRVNSAGSANEFIFGYWDVPAGYNIVVSNFRVRAYVITTNDGTNYWNFDLSKVSGATVPASLAGTGLGSGLDSSAQSAGGWFEVSESIDALIDGTSSFEQLIFSLTKTNAPGNIWYSASYDYRLVHP